MWARRHRDVAYAGLTVRVHGDFAVHCREEDEVALLADEARGRVFRPGANPMSFQLDNFTLGTGDPNGARNADVDLGLGLDRIIGGYCTDLEIGKDDQASRFPRVA